MSRRARSRATGALIAGALGCVAALGVAAAAESAADARSDALAHDIYQQLIEINTTDSVGNVTTAAEALAQRFRDAGFPAADLHVLGPNERKKNLVVRLHGAGRHKPVLIMGHLDVVEAKREDWSTDPFRLTEKNGSFYGRGTIDMKDGDAVMAAALIRMKQEGFRPDRDIIAAFTADEEGGCCNGVNWLIHNHRDLIDAEFVLNQDDWSVATRNGVPQVAQLIVSEKLYSDYQLVVTDKGGHSSVPRRDNAIYELARGLMRLSHFQFPFQLNDTTRAYFGALADGAAPEQAADMRAILKSPPDAGAIERLSVDPAYAAAMRTTCVATRLEGGHANNALPQRAAALVNCRILPGHSSEEVREKLIEVLNDPKVTVRYVADDGQIADRAPQRRALPPAPVRPEVMKPLEALVRSTWPGIKVLPYMSVGATDAIYTDAAGMPTYTFGGVTADREDSGAHGRDEHLEIKAFYTWNGFFYRYLKAVASQ